MTGPAFESTLIERAAAHGEPYLQEEHAAWVIGRSARYGAVRR